MEIRMVLFFSIFFTVYAAVNFYIFIRGWQAFAAYSNFKTLYIVVFLIVSLSYILAKFLVSYLPMFLYNMMLWIGSFWFAFMLYFFISIILIDLLRLINWQFNFFPEFVKQNYLLTKQITAVLIIFVTSVVILFGYLNTRNLEVTTLNIELPRKSGKLDSLNAVLIADIHLSPMSNKNLLSEIVKKINGLNPDIVFLAGDIVDDKARILRERNVGPSFLDIKSRYGIYACTGNHEFISGVNEAVKFMEDYKINVLRDTSVKIDDAFIIAARDDSSKSNFTGKQRMSLENVLEGTEINHPVFLLDHTPFRLDEANKNGVDLQLSGHTHNGQLFPLNIAVSLIYEQAWGYLKKGDTQYYVTCGVGTWGPPVRTGSYSEIVNLKINFVQ